jgi:hypothetical protein
MAKKPYIIALEEHCQDPEVRDLGHGWWHHGWYHHGYWYR